MGCWQTNRYRQSSRSTSEEPFHIWSGNIPLLFPSYRKTTKNPWAKFPDRIFSVSDSPKVQTTHQYMKCKKANLCGSCNKPQQPFYTVIPLLWDVQLQILMEIQRKINFLERFLHLRNIGVLYCFKEWYYCCLFLLLCDTRARHQVQFENNAFAFPLLSRNFLLDLITIHESNLKIYKIASRRGFNWLKDQY